MTCSFVQWKYLGLTLLVGQNKSCNDSTEMKNVKINYLIDIKLIGAMFHNFACSIIPEIPPLLFQGSGVKSNWKKKRKKSS